MKYFKSFLFVLNKRLYRNVGWLVGEQIVQMFISLVINMFTVRYLGPENYGSLSYTASFVSFFSAIATLGMESVVIKKLIEDSENEGSILGGCILLRLISSVISSLCIFALVFVLNPNDEIKLIIVALQSLQLVFRSFSFLEFWFQRHLRSKYIALAKIFSYIIVAFYKIILLVTSKSLSWFAFSFSLDMLLISIVLYIYYAKNNGPRIRFSLYHGMNVLKDSYHFILSGLLITIYSQMDKVMIGNMLTDKAVGLYSTATTICGLWIFIPMAIINSARPVIVQSKVNGSDRYLVQLEKTYSVIIWLCISISILICIFSGFIINFLYGGEFLGAINTLRIAIWFETFAMIGSARGIWILAEEKYSYVKYFMSVGVLTNFALNYIFIPIWGIEGAAIATLITQIVTSVVVPLFFKATRIHTKIVWDSFVLKWYFGYKTKEN